MIKFTLFSEQQFHDFWQMLHSCNHPCKEHFLDPPLPPKSHILPSRFPLTSPPAPGYHWRLLSLYLYLFDNVIKQELKGNHIIYGFIYLASHIWDSFMVLCESVICLFLYWVIFHGWGYHSFFFKSTCQLKDIRTVSRLGYL